MKSFLLSLLLILSFGFSTHAVDQLDQPSKIVKDLHSHFEFDLISTGQDVTPKVKSQSDPFIASHTPEPAKSSITLASVQSANFSSQDFSNNFISSGASLAYDLSLSHP